MIHGSTEADVQAALKGVTDPNTGRDFVTGKSVKKVTVTGDDVAVELALGYPAKSQHETLKKLVQDARGATLPGAGRVNGEHHARRSSRMRCSAA